MNSKKKRGKKKEWLLAARKSLREYITDTKSIEAQYKTDTEKVIKSICLPILVFYDCYNKTIVSWNGFQDLNWCNGYSRFFTPSDRYSEYKKYSHSN